jgi:hypothetical protein
MGNQIDAAMIFYVGGLRKYGVLAASVSEAYPIPYSPHQTVMIVVLRLFAWVTW